MEPKILLRSLFGLVLFLSVQLQAQEKDSETLTQYTGENTSNDTVISPAAASEWLPTTSLYVELGGRVLYSLNADFRRKENFAFSIGASYVKEDNGDSVGSSQSMFFPSVMGYYLGGKKHRIELGGGLCPGLEHLKVLQPWPYTGVQDTDIRKRKVLFFVLHLLLF